MATRPSKEISRRLTCQNRLDRLRNFASNCDSTANRSDFSRLFDPFDSFDRLRVGKIKPSASSALPRMTPAISARFAHIDSCLFRNSPPWVDDRRVGALIIARVAGQ